MAGWNAKGLGKSREEHMTKIARLLAHSNQPKSWLAVPIMIMEIDKLHAGMDS
jgi:hypothetical protein